MIRWLVILRSAKRDSALDPFPDIPSKGWLLRRRSGAVGAVGYRDDEVWRDGGLRCSFPLEAGYTSSRLRKLEEISAETFSACLGKSSWWTDFLRRCYGGGRVRLSRKPESQSRTSVVLRRQLVDGKCECLDTPSATHISYMPVILTIQFDACRQ